MSKSIILNYFNLQLILTSRKFTDAGIIPWLGSSLAISGFGLLSACIYHKTVCAGYILALFYTSLILPLGENRRNDFINMLYGDEVKRKIRLLENTLTALPFLLVLLIQGDYYIMPVIVIISIYCALISTNSGFNKTLPTPYFRHPDEFTSGFRKSILMVILSFILASISVIVDNFNLGIFAILLGYIISMSYYSLPEGEFYIWIHSRNPQAFILHKVLRAFRNSFILILPVLLLMFAFHPSKILILLGFCIVGMAFLAMIIVAKYSAYPSEINIPESFLIGMTILFPPVLLAVIPYFYKKSITKLKKYLHYDQN